MIEIKELKKLVAFMRKAGVLELSQDGLVLKITQEAPSKQHKILHKANRVDVSEQLNIPTDEPTRDELLFWSAGGIPEETKDS